MFSPDVTVHAGTATRNPRRRQRTGSEDSVALRQNPKRLRRSRLSSETFQPPAIKQVNGYTDHGDGSSVANGCPQHVTSIQHASVDTASLAIRHRGPKQLDKERKGSRANGSIELTKNENYIVTQLPTTPEQLQDYRSSERWHGEISSGLGYAVAMTQTQALVWRYVQGVNATEGSRPLTIKLSNPSNNARHPLPLGILVPTSAEPALLVVMPMTGKMTYWENIQSAASVDPTRQKQQGIQGSLGGMLSGETINKLTEGEPHGFVLTLSSGRVAHLTVSDPHGKPSINVQFLRNNGAHSGGLFGSLKSAFGGAGWRRDVAAVKAGKSWQRGQRFIVLATTKGAVQIWDLHWNGTHSLLHELDAKRELLKALAEGGSVFQDHDEHLFEILDFTFLNDSETGKELTKSISKEDCKLLVLTAVSGADFTRYALLTLTIADGSFDVMSVHPISCYTASLPTELQFRPQILVPDPPQTAFVIFEKSVVLVSLVKVEDSPISQLQMEAHTLPDPFQDTIDFRKSKSYRVVGCASEAQDRNHAYSSCIVMVYGFGVIRVAALPMKDGQSVRDRARVTAKTKIEQAVFFGSLEQDLLDFSGRPEISFDVDEVEAAALEVSSSIMKSTSTYLSALGPSTEHQLQQRSAALTDLIKHLRRYHQPLSRLARWELLWSAEQMAAARAVWRSYNVTIGSKRQDGKHLLIEVIESLHARYKVETKPENHETDEVRHWFIHDIWRLQYLIQMAHQMCKVTLQWSEEDHAPQDAATQARHISEASDIQLSALETAFRFREENAALYGVDNEVLIDGVLAKGYEDLPEIWTSSLEIVPTVKILTDLARESASYGGKNAGLEGMPSQALVNKLAAENPRQVQICCQTYIERFRWLKSRTEPQRQAEGEIKQDQHFQVRKILIEQLSEINQQEAGIRLAEKYHEMGALVNILDDLMDKAGTDLEIRPIEQRINTYFVKFGAAWADAYFTKHIRRGNVIAVFETAAKHHQKHLTQFLQQHPAYAKLSWINEVVSMQDFVAAAEDLRVAYDQETSLWGKKIELSLAKLAIMAANAKEQVEEDQARILILESDRGNAILDIQDKLYQYIKPTLQGAIDITAETDIAMDQFAKDSIKGKPALHQIMEQSMGTLVAREVLDPEELIDTLTLMNGNATKEDEGFADTRFFSALKVLRLSTFDSDDPGGIELYEKFIWRRCMIQDSWEAINRTESKNDMQVEVETGATALFKTLKEGYQTDFWTNRPPLPPSTLLSAGTTPSSLETSIRFASLPADILQAIAKDLESEDALLKMQIERGRLGVWWKGVVDAAKASVRKDREAAGEERRRRRSSALRGRERSSSRSRVRSKERKGHEGVNGNGNGNGTGKEVEREIDGQGDVVMGN